MISPENIKQVACIIGKAAKARAVILFGSYARNTAGPDSDVDLFVIADSSLPRYKRSRALYRMFKPYPFGMDILIYTPAEVEQSRQSKLSFVSTVLHEGKVLYGQCD